MIFIAAIAGGSVPSPSAKLNSVVTTDLFFGFNLVSCRTDQAQMTKAWDDPPPAREIVEAWLDDVRPALIADGGNIELIAVDYDGTVRVSMQGACAECPAQLATLRIGIEEPLKRSVPGVRSVVAIDP